MKAMRDVYQETLRILMDQDPKVVMLDADLASASGSSKTFQNYPDQTINVGISEANMMSSAAGLRLSGMKPFVHTFAPFATRRVYDQLYMSVAYSKNPIHIYGSDPGFWAQHNGGTHTSFEDLSLMLSLPGFIVTAPVDKYQGSQIVRTALNILMLTGLRPGELRKSEWSFIDFESKTWKLPEKIMKMGRVHVVPMSDQVISLLRQIQPISGDYQYIFPSRTNHKKHLSEMAINTMIGRMGYRGRATGHGFRHTMSTILHEKGFNTAWIELQLAHVDKNSIRGTYNHALYLEGRREMMQWYADYIDELRSKKK